MLIVRWVGALNSMNYCTLIFCADALCKKCAHDFAAVAWKAMHEREFYCDFILCEEFNCAFDICVELIF